MLTMIRAAIVAAMYLLLLSAPAHAQQLSTTQMQALRTLCLADQTCAPMAAAANDEGLASWFNATEASWIVWRTSVPVDDIMRNGMDWARVDNLSVGKARIWDWMGRLGVLDCSKANVRAGIDATWVGTAADLAVRATIYGHCKRLATRAERALSTGTGSNADPATMTFEGQITPQVASLIRS